MYSITASGLVVTYATSGIFNFAHGALGMLGAFTYWQLTVAWHVPPLAALALVLLVVAPLLGAVVERVLIRRLYGTSLSVTLVVTVGLLLALIGVANLIWSPVTPRVLKPFFPNSLIHLPGVNVSAHQAIVVLVSLLVAVALRVFLARTRTGATMRAVVDDPGLVALTGTSPARASQLSWALGSSLAALAGILLAPLVTLSILTLTLLVINGYAAAVVGRLRSLPLTAVGGLALGLAESYSTGYLGGDLPNLLRPALPMFLLFVAVVFLRDTRLRAGGRIVGWSPRAVGLGESVRWSSLLLVVALLAAALAPGGLVDFLSSTLAIGFVLLSLVLLSGYAGQVSLCQLTFVGVGAYVMAKVAPGGSAFGILVVVPVCALLGVAVAVPVLRLRGLYLALATLAFASGMDTIFFLNAFGTGGAISVPRLSLPGVDSNRGYLILLTLAFAAGAVGLLSLRRSRVGRRMSALNDSPAACVTLGVGVNRTKLGVFAGAAAMSGLGGVLLGGQEGLVSGNDFQMLNSLVLLLILTIGGASTVSGALLGAVLFSAFPIIAEHVSFLSQASLLLTGLGAVSIGRNPYGIVGEASRRFAAARQAGRGALASVVIRPSPLRDGVL
ncbi:MAG: amino acid/amide transporter rane protein 2, family / amino acid/amide transporter [Frankiales bacterium]|nr:amino acid/amide transporter rane protein 2, family / amino acid/amide transporter [Frankiales bacterium]